MLTNFDTLETSEQQNLPRFMDSVLVSLDGTSPTPFQYPDDLPLASKLISLLGEGNFARIKPLLATLFWQISMGRSMHPSPPWPDEVIVVAHGNPEQPSYNLLTLSLSRTGEPEFFSHSALLRYFDWAMPLERWRTMRERQLREQSRLGLLSPQTQNRLQSLIEAVDVHSLKILEDSNDFFQVIANFPEPEFTALPTTPWGISIGGAGASSTAGILVSDSQNREGVTACYHGICGASAGTSLTVGNLTGTIINWDAISDGVFVELKTRPPMGSYTTSSGPLRGVSPRQNEQVQFKGFETGQCSTVVHSWSMDLPFVAPYNQLKIYTDRVTKPGDSGAALLDSSGNILGFSFYRSSSNTTPAFQPGAGPTPFSRPLS